jgi:small subunit ribosomal protein S5
VSESKARQPRASHEGRGDFEERVIHVNRCAKVVKGGRRFSFSALIVVGDRKGHVGFALGKANEVADAIRKGTDQAKRNMFQVTMKDKTIPHEVEYKFSGAKVFMRPASPGTGVIAGGGMRAILELAGVRDVLAKSLGSTNPLNVIRATVGALEKLQSREDIESERREIAVS